MIVVGWSLPAAAWGQAPLFERLLQPETLGKATLRLDYEAEFRPARPVAGQNSRLEQRDHDVTLQFPLHQSETDEWTAYGVFRERYMTGDLLFPDTLDNFPDQLWDVRLGAAYRANAGGGALWGGNLEVGSASDRPFASGDEVLVQANAFYRLPHGERNAWLFLLNFSNNRDFAQFIPLPGVAYELRLNRDSYATVGVPFSNIRWRFLPQWRFDAFYFIPRTVQARVTYEPTENIDLYVGYDWRNERYAWSERRDDDDRLFFFEQRVGGGARWDVSDAWYVDLFGGWAFDRFSFVGRNYDERDQNRLDVADGPVFRVQVGARF